VISPAEGLERIHARYGVHARHRALHAKGSFYRASFTATPRAAELTRAPHLAGTPVPAVVRFSNGGGDPTVPDYAPDVRGLAVGFELPDGARTDILAQTLPAFPFPDQEGFFAAMALGRPGPGTLLKLPGFALRHPRALAKLPEANRFLGERRSFAARRYFAFHAFKWIAADGSERFVRYRWLPTADEPELSKEETRKRGRNWLFDELAERLAAGPVRMELEVQIAADGDEVDDPSAEWPAERERVVVGTLEVTAPDPDADDGMVFDPRRLTDGIEATADPVLRYRPAVYDLSHAERTAG